MAKTTGAAPKAQQPQPSDGGNKPVETIRSRNLKATIWRNEGAHGPFHSVTFTRSYRDEQDQWHDVAGGYGTNDLPLLAKLVADAHSWITREERRQQQQREPSSSRPAKA